MTSLSGYQMEHYGKARRALMAPFHNDDENEGFRSAFDECSHAIADLQEKSTEDRESVEDSVGEYLDVVRQAVDTTGLVDSDTDPQGLYAVKARQMTRDEKQKFSHAVDLLASHFTIETF